MASSVAVEVPFGAAADLKRRTSSVTATTGKNSPMLLSLTKKLKRMPHLFDRVLELPFHADTLVGVQESRDSFSFVVKMPGLVAKEVKPELVEIVPGAIKVVIQGGGQGLLFDLESSEVELWRFRLPASTIPEATVARYKNEVLEVTIPKNPVSCATAAEDEVFKRDNDTENDPSFKDKDGPETDEADTRQAANMDSSSSTEEYESTRNSHELQWQRDLFEDLESFGSPRRVRQLSSCTKAAVQQGASSPDFLRNLGSWVHGFAIFV
jgi:HSP20 family molecular chaperone IbpA